MRYQSLTVISLGIVISLFVQKSVAQPQCVDIATPKAAIEAQKGGKWIELTNDQWQFLRGIYAMNPLTPPGLPFGDKAVLARVDANDGGLVFFIDGDKACSPMPIPKQLLEMMDDIATATISHEGKGL